MKELLKDFLAGFFISVTLIDAAMLILGVLLRPDQRFGYEVFMYPLIYGCIGMMPALVIQTKRELSIKQVIIRKAMQLFLLIVLLLGFIFNESIMEPGMTGSIIWVTISIVVIYFLVSIIEWMMDEREAKSMTEDLLKLQKRLEN